MVERREGVASEELDAIIRDPDPFVVLIRGHQAVEEMLNLVLSETLHDPHAVEVNQLGFGLKVDLATALGVIGDRSVLLGLNRFRNRFAHDRAASFTQQDAADYFNTWSPEFREWACRTRVVPDEDPSAVFSEAILVLVLMLERRITHLRDEKAHAEITHEMVNEVRGIPSTSGHTRGDHENVYEYIDRRIRMAREERHARGEL